MERFFLVLLVGLAMSAVLTAVEIPLLKKKQFKQYIREEGPESHQKKSGTPTMGGIAMILAQLVVVLIFGGFGAENLMMICVMLLFGAIGFFDDFINEFQLFHIRSGKFQSFSSFFFILPATP